MIFTCARARECQLRLASTPNFCRSAIVAETPLHASSKMTGFLSLPDEVVELIGKRVVDRYDLSAWCRVTSTCKRLWGMQLPGSASSWTLCIDDIGSESVSMLCCLLDATIHACGTQPALINAGAPWEMLRIRSTRALTIWRTNEPQKKLHLDVLRQTVKALIRASRSFPNLTTLVDVLSILPV